MTKVTAQSKPGLRNTHFVTAGKSTRQAMAGKEAGKIHRGPDQRSQFIQQVLIASLLCIRHYLRLSFGNIKGNP